MNREQVYQALFARGQGAAGFNTQSRWLKHIEDLSPPQFPAFYQYQVEEQWSHTAGNLPPMGSLRVEWWVYVQSGDETVPHSALLNPLVDALCASLGLPPAFSPSPAGGQTLNGLVTSVQLDGPIQYAEGILGDRGFAKIPILLKTTA